MTEQTLQPPAEEASTKHRMPEHLSRFLLRMQGGKAYLPAAYRLVWFRDECPDWGIETAIVEGGQADGYATVKATIRNPEGRIVATAHKTETKADFPAGWVEKAETGSIARALAAVGYGTQFSALVDANEETRPADSPQPTSGGTWVPRSAGSLSAMRDAVADGTQREALAAGVLIDAEVWEAPGLCPRCHAPEGKRHGKECMGQRAQAAGR